MSYGNEKSQNPNEFWGSLLTKPGYLGNKAIFPAWDSKSQKSTVFRPFGPATNDRSNFLPWRVDSGANQFGDWIYGSWVFRGGSAETISVLANIPNPEQLSQVLGDTANPLSALVNGFYKMTKGLDERSEPRLLAWSQMAKGGAGRRAKIARAQYCAFIQGALVIRGDKDYRTNPRAPALLVLPKSAREALELLIDGEVQGYAGDAGDFNARYLCGNMLDADNGKMIVVKSPAANADDVDIEAADFSGKNDKTKAGGERDFKGFLVTLAKSPKLPRTKSGELLHVAAGKGWQPWDKVLNVLTPIEMADILIRAFSDQPEFLQYVWRDTEILPKQREILAALVTKKNAVTANAAAKSVHPPTQGSDASAGASTAPEGAKDEEPGFSVNWADSVPPTNEDVAERKPEQDLAATGTPGTQPIIDPTQSARDAMKKLREEQDKRRAAAATKQETATA